MRSHGVRFVLLGLAGLALAAGPALADKAEGPVGGLHAPDAAWPRWQTRLGVETPYAPPGGLAPQGRYGQRSSVALFSDYYLLRNTAHNGGLRATGGLFVGPVGSLWSPSASARGLALGLSTDQRRTAAFGPGAGSAHGEATDPEALSYLGLGYTHLSPYRESKGLGFAFSADLGLTLGTRSAVRFGDAGADVPSAVDLMRDLQLNPLMNVGISYAF